MLLNQTVLCLLMKANNSSKAGCKWIALLQRLKPYKAPLADWNSGVSLSTNLKKQIVAIISEVNVNATDYHVFAHLICVVHAHSTATSRKVIDLPFLASASISRGEDDLELSRLIHNEVCCSVL